MLNIWKSHENDIEYCIISIINRNRVKKTSEIGNCWERHEDIHDETDEDIHADPAGQRSSGWAAGPSHIDIPERP